MKVTRREDWRFQTRQAPGRDAGRLTYPAVRSASLVVAASDASQWEKDQADFLCDGTADDVEIQEAVNALPAGGGKVLLSSGIFTLAAEISRAIANVSILGSGSATRLVNDASTSLITAGSQLAWDLGEFDVDAGSVNIGTGAGTIAHYWLNGVWINQAQGRGETEFADVQMAAAVVNDLKDTNIEMVPAPGAGLAVIPTAVYMFLDHGGTDFVQNAGTDQLALKYNGSSQIVELGLAATFTTFIHASGDASLFINFAESALAAVGALGFAGATANKAIDLDNNGATDLATGNGTLSFRTYFRTVPLAAFS